MLFEGLTHAGPRNNVLDGVKIRQIHSQMRGVTSRQCGLLPSYFWTLVVHSRVVMVVNVCVCIVGVGRDCTIFKVGNAHCGQSRQAKPVCTTQHQPSRTEGESEGGMFQQ